MPLRTWISRRQAAEILGVSPQSVSNYAEKGLIQTRKQKTDRYPLFYKPEVEALAADKTFLEARVIENRAIQIKQDAQQLLEKSETEYARRQKDFENAFGALFPNADGFQLYGNLQRYRMLLQTLIEKTDIGSANQAILLGVLNGQTPGQICEQLGVVTGYFYYRYRKALKALIRWYSDKDEQIKSLQNTAETLRAEITGTKRENQLLAEALKDQERAETIQTASDNESKRDLILRTCRPYNIPLRNVCISIRALNCARAADIETLGQLAVLSRSDVMKWRNAGRKSINELEEILAHYGLSFGHDPVAQLNPRQENNPQNATDNKESIKADKSRTDTPDEEPWSIPLSKTYISAHLQRLLAGAGVTTVGQLAKMTHNDLKAIKGLGDSSIKEATRLLRRFNINK